MKTAKQWLSDNGYNRTSTLTIYQLIRLLDRFLKEQLESEPSQPEIKYPEKFNITTAEKSRYYKAGLRHGWEFAIEQIKQLNKTSDLLSSQPVGGVKSADEVLKKIFSSNSGIIHRDSNGHGVYAYLDVILAMELYANQFKDKP